MYFFKKSMLYELFSNQEPLNHAQLFKFSVLSPNNSKYTRNSIEMLQFLNTIGQ